MTDTAPPTVLDRLDPLQRADHDARPVRRWRVTWPDGSSELVRAHWLSGAAEVWTFGWMYIGAYRMINPAHVRDIVEIDPEADR